MNIFLIFCSAATEASFSRHTASSLATLKFIVCPPTWPASIRMYPINSEIIPNSSSDSGMHGIRLALIFFTTAIAGLSTLTISPKLDIACSLVFNFSKAIFEKCNIFIILLEWAISNERTVEY